jgi:hypothetical protein
MSVTDHRIERQEQPDDFRKVFALATQTVVTLLTVVVVSRRASGAFAGTVGPAIPCFVATLVTILSLAALALWRQTAPRPTKQAWIPAAAMGWAVLAPVALGAALWISPSALVGGYLAGLAIMSLLCAIAIEDWTVGFGIASQVRSILFNSQTAPATSPDARVALAACPPVSAAKPREAATDEQTATAPVHAAESESEPLPDDESESDDSIVQWMARRRLADGGEVIEGAVRIDLDAVERVGVAHLSFVPPLCCDPRAECHLLCDFDGRVRITAAKSYGLRIEARQSGQTTRATTINVAFSAQAPPAASRAAAA